jgi:hypothetical protein
VVLTLTACVLAQSGATSLRLAGVGVLAAIAVLVTFSGFAVSRRRLTSSAAAYLEYVVVAAVVPLALWPLGIYDSLGLW